MFQFINPSIHLDIIDSTNNYLNQLAKTSIPANGTVVSTGFQTNGRGQHGNGWESNANENLLFSIFFDPMKLQPEMQFILSMAVSLGINDYLTGVVKNSSIKWPNDIYVDNNKIAGILIENQFYGSKWMYSIVGIGFNINQKSFSSFVPNPTSLAKISGRSYIISDVFKSILYHIETRIIQLYNFDYENIKVNYLKSLFLFNQFATFKVEEDILHGKIVDVAFDGLLTIQLGNGEKKHFYFKELQFVLNSI